MLERAEVARRIEGFLRDRFAIDAGDAHFNADVHLFDYGYVDSFGAVELTTFLESAFQIVISSADLVHYPMNTVNELADFVVRRKRGEC